MCGDCAISFYVNLDENQQKARMYEENRASPTSMLAHVCKFLRSDSAVSAGAIMATATALRTTLMTFCVNMADDTWVRYPSLRTWIHEAAGDPLYQSDSHSAATKVQTKFWQGEPIPWTDEDLWYGYAAILQCNIVIFPVVLNGFTNTWMSAPFTNGPDRGFMPPSFFAPPDGIPARFTAYIANFNEFVSDELGRTSLRSYHYAPLIVPISNWAQRQFTGQCGSLPTAGWTKDMGYFASVGALMGSAARPEGNRPLSTGDISL
jgi:hypothetical protein